MIARALDSLIAVFSPRWGLERASARATLSQIEAFTGADGGYAAGKLNRLTKYRLGSPVKESAIPADQVARLRWQAWTLYRNNPYARKIVRAIQSQVIGKGIRPASATRTADGAPHGAFRARAQELWQGLAKGFDWRGLPGRGGLSLVQIQRLALSATILGGEVLAQVRPLTKQEQSRRNLPVPLALQLIDADRLAGDTVAANDARIYRGIELDAEGRRVAYHVSDYPAGETTRDQASVRRIPAERMMHLFVEEDVDQLRGVSWFASALLQMRDTGDYQYNELKASAMAACIVLGYTRPTGATKFGLTQAADVDTTDDDGNPITAIQPGMLVNLGRDGKMQGFNPARPGANAEAFIQHMLRGTAAALPGVKASTVTGDYRNSSFSSERSADNDCWPELEALQEWFAGGFLQPIYEEVITAAVLAGWFDGIVTPAAFISDRANYLAADWQGPVARSINPVDDANAARYRIQGGLSSPQIEAAAIGRNWQDILRDLAEFSDYAQQLGLPEEVVNNILSVDAQDVTDGGDAGKVVDTTPVTEESDSTAATDASGGTETDNEEENDAAAA